MNNYNTLILSGGGVNGLTHLGALKALEELNILKNIKTFCGISIGSIISLLIIIGYTPKDIFSVVMELDLNELKEFHENIINSFLKDFGAMDNKKIFNIVEIFMKKREISPKITFLELYEKTKIKFIVNRSHLNSSSSIFYDYENSPDICVLDIIKSSSTIPFIFNCVRENDDIYVDGGIANNFPINLFKDDIDTTLGIFIKNPIKYRKEITSLQDYCFSILQSCFNQMNNTMLKYNNNKNIIVLRPTTSSVDFSINNNQKENLFFHGYRQTLQFFHKNEFNKVLIQLN